LKKFLSLLLFSALLLSLFCLSPAALADTSSVRNRKIVSVVYDDSGSMEGDKWEYTSYAMQCFAAMLNKEDRLDITYMSSYAYGAFSVDTNNRADSVRRIREHRDSGGTPVEAVDAGFNTLKSVNDNNANTQYWLIVMTDGQMGDVERRVNNMAETKMPNGTKPHIVYLTLCDVNNEYTPSFSKSNIENRSAKTADEIIDVISDIACNISGRYPVEASAIKVIDDTTVEVTSDLPLINIGILSQRSSAQVVSVVDKEGNTLQNEGNVPVKAPGFYPSFLSADAMASLNGNVALFSAAGGNIPAGTYTVTFSEPVAKKDLVIMFEPAFELRLELSVDGVPISDPSQLTEESLVDVEAVLYEVGTGNKIAMSMLPNGYKTSISHWENGKQITEDSSLKLKGITLKAVETELSATLEIPGFFTVTDLIRFNPMPIMLSNMTAELHFDGSDRMTDENGQPDPQNVIYITSLDTNETGIAFRLYIDGEPISRDKALAVQSLFTDRLSVDFPNFDVTVANDGRLIVSPNKTHLPALVYWWLYQGEHTVSCTYDGITASGTLIFKIGSWEDAIGGFVIVLGIVFLIIYLILWIFAKHHFTRVGLIRAFRAQGKNSPYVGIASATKRIHWLAASGPLNFFGLGGMRKRLKGTKFYVRATAGGSYRVEGVKKMRVSTSVKYPSLSMSPCPDRYYDFDSTVYIFDGAGTYYKITVN